MAAGGKSNIEQRSEVKAPDSTKTPEVPVESSMIFDQVIAEIDANSEFADSVYKALKDVDMLEAYDHVTAEYAKYKEAAKMLKVTSLQQLETLKDKPEEKETLLKEYTKEAEEMIKTVKKLNRSFEEIINNKKENDYCDRLLSQLDRNQ